MFDFCALEGLGAWLVARQPQLGSSQQLLLFDLIVPNEPGYVANVFDLRVPAVWVPCIQQHVALPPILSLLSPVSHFVEHMHGDQPTTSGPAKQHLSAVETLVSRSRQPLRTLSLVGWPPRSPAVLAHLNAGAGSPPLTRRSRSTTARPVCGCPRLAHGGRVRRPRSGPRGGRRRPRQSLLPWEPVADAERMRSDGDAGGAGESGAWPGRRRGTRPASGCPW